MPTGVLFTVHWYVGAEPPWVGVAVKVTLVLTQTAPEGDAEMATMGVIVEVTVIVTLSLAVVGLAQVALDVMVQAMMSSFDGV